MTDERGAPSSASHQDPERIESAAAEHVDGSRPSHAVPEQQQGPEDAQQHSVSQQGHPTAWYPAGAHDGQHSSAPIAADEHTTTYFNPNAALYPYQHGQLPHYNPYMTHQNRPPYANAYRGSSPLQQTYQLNTGWVPGVSDNVSARFANQAAANGQYEAAYAMSSGGHLHPMQMHGMTAPMTMIGGASGSNAMYSSPGGTTSPSAFPSPIHASPYGGHNRQVRRPYGQRRGTGRAQDALARMTIHGSGETSVMADEQQQQPQHRKQQQRQVSESSAEVEGSVSDRQSQPSSKSTSVSGGASFLPPKPDFAPHPVQPDAATSIAERGHSDWHTRPPVAGGGGSPAARRVTPSAAPTAPTVPLLSRLPPLPPRPVPRPNSSVQDIEREYKAREDALLLRLEAIGFQPESAWELMKDFDGQVKENTQKKSDDVLREAPAPILGIRLLQRVDALQRENDELGELLSERETGRGESELEDAHQLITTLDEALTKTRARAESAEASVASLERALAVACAQNSRSISETRGKEGSQSQGAAGART